MYSKNKPPSTVDCSYCGETTSSYQLVSQVPETNCPQNFILESLKGVLGSPLNKEDYICFEHEETFRIKFLLKQRGLYFEPMYTSKFDKKEDSVNAWCAICESKTIMKYIRVNTIQSLRFKNFIFNEASISSKRVTRAGTGMGEADVLCAACYMSMRRKFINVNYSPVKASRTLSKSVSHYQESTAADTESGTAEQSSSKQVPECVVCSKNKKDGVWTSVSELHRKWFTELKRLIPGEKWGNLVIPAGQCRMHGPSGRSRCSDKLWKEIRSLAKCCYCNLGLSPEKEVIPVDKSMKEELECWIIRNGKDVQNFYKDEIHKKCYTRTRISL